MLEEDRDKLYRIVLEKIEMHRLTLKLSLQTLADVEKAFYEATGYAKPTGGHDVSEYYQKKGEENV